MYVLKLLNEGEKTGYEIMKEIESKIEGWRPSTGTIYPLLQELEKNNLVSSIEVDRRKIYRITESGEKLLCEFRRNREKLFKFMIHKLGCISEEFFGKKGFRGILNLLLDHEHKPSEENDVKGRLFHNLYSLIKKIRELHWINVSTDTLEQVNGLVKDVVEKIDDILKQHRDKR